MNSSTFKEWVLDKLDKAFNLKQVWQSELLARWQNNDETVDEFEQQTLQQLQC